MFIGEDGRPVATPLDSRMIVTPGPALEQIPFVLAVAYGVSKSTAVCAAIRGEWSMAWSPTRVSPAPCSAWLTGEAAMG